jgi:hypothetical protein
MNSKIKTKEGKILEDEILDSCDLYGYPQTIGIVKQMLGCETLSEAQRYLDDLILSSDEKLQKKGKKMNNKQIDKLGEVLALFERFAERDTGVKYHSGGFAHAEMVDFDDQYLDIQLKWGIQSDCQNQVNIENYKLPVHELDDRGAELICRKIQEA